MRISSRIVTVCLALVLLLPAAAFGQQSPRPANWREQPLNDQLLEEAVRKAVDYLWSVQHKEGHWEKHTIAELQQAARDPGQRTATNSVPGIYGGATSLVLMALLSAGEKPEREATREKFSQAIKFLQACRPTQTYANGLLTAAFSSLDARSHQTQLRDGRQWLLDAMYADGLYGYNPPANDAQRNNPGSVHRDLSATQYAALGMWLLSDAGAEIPKGYWQRLMAGYLKNQQADGGWGYRPGEKQQTYQSMTVGALATLFIVWDKLYTERCNQVPPAELRRSIDRGIDWLAKNFSGSNNAGRPGWFVLYTLYGIERVGVASGLKYFGEHDWWDQCARYALYTQRADGSWPASYHSAPEPVSTAWALLFLSYGRAPVVFSKLDYASNALQWNARPRDLARLTEWMYKSYERLFSWQVTPISRPVHELLDAPIMVMSGRAGFELTAEEKSKLRDYMLNGGLLLGEAVDNSPQFIASYRALAVDLFPEAELAPLRPEHPIYNVHFSLNDARGPGGNVPRLEGIDNNIRTLMLLSPRDLGCAWQRNEVATNRRLFELGANIKQYATDRGRGLLGRGTSYMLKDLGKNPVATMTVGRLVWGGRFNWDPEPAAWQRMDVVLRNADILSLNVIECDFKQPVDPAQVPLVHVTGTVALALTAEQKANLKTYIAAGGLLLSDSAGGKTRAFGQSVERLAGELFGPLVPAAPTWLGEVHDDRGTVQLRRIENLPRAFRPLQLLGVNVDGRWGMLHIPYDLTCAMAGYPNIEPVGLAPDSAERFLIALLKSLQK